jgi:hypothetical protein
MRNKLNRLLSGRLFVRLYLITALIILSAGRLFAQEEPPMPIVVSGIQNISFGSFVQLGGTGTVTLSHDGIRNGSNVSFIGAGYMSGRFVIEGTINTPVTILVDQNPITLSNGGGGTMSLTINSWSFPTPPNYVLPTSSPSTSTVYFGGALTVPPGSPSGTYTGNLSFTFIQNNE